VIQDNKFIEIKNYIGGKWVEEQNAEKVSLCKPSDGNQIGRVPLSTPETSERAVKAGYDAYDSWRNLSVNKRMSYLYRIRQAMIDKEEDLAFSIALDQAKHISEARGGFTPGNQ